MRSSRSTSIAGRTAATASTPSPEDDGDDRFALISHHFFYFGRNAIDISDIPRRTWTTRSRKPGRGIGADFSEEFVEAFAKWLKANFKVGVHGPPCKPHSELKLPKCPAKVRRKGCTA